MNLDIEMRRIEYGTDEYEVSIDIRDEAFRKPWGMNIRDEDLTGDRNMDMYGAYLDGKMIGTVFLTEDDKETARVKSVAILEKYRRHGLGRYMMDFIEDRARDKGYIKVNLMGRVSAEDFYHKLGYSSISKHYDYHTIPHLDMTKEL